MLVMDDRSAEHLCCALPLPDGDVISSGQDGTLTRWDVGSRRPRWSIQMEYSSENIYLLRDGGLLTIGVEAEIWNIATGSSRRRLDGRTDLVLGACELPDGNVVTYSDADDCTLRVWNTSTGALTQTLTGHTSAVWTALALPDGFLASGGSDGVRIWDLATGGSRAVEGISGVETLLLTTRGSLLAADGNRLSVYDVATASCLRTMELSDPDGRIMIRNLTHLPGDRVAATGEEVQSSLNGENQSLEEAHEECGSAIERLRFFFPDRGISSEG